MLEALLLASALALAQADEAVDAEPSPTAEDSGGEGDDTIVSLADYQMAQVNRADVAGGRTKVSVETSAPSPRAGSFPVRFFIDNSTGPAGAVAITVRSMVSGSQHVVSRAVEVTAGERRVLNVPVPAEMRYGTVTARGPGISTDNNASMYFQSTYEPQRVVLSLSRPEQFEKYVGRKPRYSGANVLVHAIPPNEAPAELASYLGYDLVAVPDGATLDGLDEAQRRALEAFVATGGHLLVGGTVRSLAVFPLLNELKAGPQPYGFGSLIISKGAPKGTGDVFRPAMSVSPMGPLPDYERRYNRDSAADVLLPQATAPLGRFLVIIMLFTLAIGPGSVWVARRRGPATLLLTIPGTALATCAAIIGYSVVADGFTVHGSVYGYTLLDGKQHRAITQGVTAYYANLSPSRATFPAGTMVVAPHTDRRERYISDLTWAGDGLKLGGDFVPSRLYREWGFVSVEPTRARLVVKRKGDGYVLQNALGTKVSRVAVNLDGRFFTGGPVRDGGEVELAPGHTLSYTGTKAANRFGTGVAERVAHDPLTHRQFLARIVDEEAFVPSGGIRMQLHAAEHWVRGEVEE